MQVLVPPGPLCYHFIRPVVIGVMYLRILVAGRPTKLVARAMALYFGLAFGKSWSGMSAACLPRVLLSLAGLCRLKSGVAVSLAPMRRHADDWRCWAVAGPKCCNNSAENHIGSTRSRVSMQVPMDTPATTLPAPVGLADRRWWRCLDPLRSNQTLTQSGAVVALTSSPATGPGYRSIETVR